MRKGRFIKNRIKPILVGRINKRCGIVIFRISKINFETTTRISNKLHRIAVNGKSPLTAICYFSKIVIPQIPFSIKSSPLYKFPPPKKSRYKSDVIFFIYDFLFSFPFKEIFYNANNYIIKACIIVSCNFIKFIYQFIGNI